MNSGAPAAKNKRLIESQEFNQEDKEIVERKEQFIISSRVLTQGHPAVSDTM